LYSLSGFQSAARLWLDGLVLAALVGQDDLELGAGLQVALEPVGEFALRRALVDARVVDPAHAGNAAWVCGL
jgi:hypothetical protein